MKSLLSLLFVCIVQLAFSQSASVAGKITDISTGEELVGITITVEGTTKGAVTDLFGEFVIPNLVPGRYFLLCRNISYEELRYEISVEEGQTLQLTLNMEVKKITAGKTVEIVASRNYGSEASLNMQIKEATQVVSGAGSEQIRKSQDRDASQVARRISGVTVIDNRFVMVRGLSERYNAVMMNGLLVPSFETDVKTFSFDVIPSGMIDRFLIYKSPSADLPGEYAGGAINVYTLSVPDKPLMVGAGFEVGFRPGTTLRSFNSNVKGAKDWLGFDDGSRQLPSGFPTNLSDVDDPAQIEANGKALDNTLFVNETKASLDLRWNANVAQRFDLNKGSIGYLLALNYSDTYQSLTSYRNKYNVYDFTNEQSDTVFAFSDDISQRTVRTGGILNFGYQRENYKIEFKNFLNQSGMEENAIRGGKHIMNGDNHNDYSFRYNQRTIYMGQLLGNVDMFNKRGLFEGVVGYSITRRNDPDWRQIAYRKPFEDASMPFAVPLTSAATPEIFGRLFIDMDEDIYSTSMAYEHKLFKIDKTDSDNAFVSLKAGYYRETKQRDFGIRNMGYVPSNFFTFNYDLTSLGLTEILNPENINAVDGFRLSEDTKGSDSYEASNDLSAYFIMAKIPYQKWHVSAGLRVEHNIQKLSSYTLQDRPIEVNNDKKDIFPSASVKYNITEKSLVRAAYGKTINRPEFREIAPYAFFDFTSSSLFYGNDTLKNAIIHNFDLRYEFYPRPSEMISIGVFRKEFINPIELYFLTSGGGTDEYKPGNAASASSLGVELDLRKSLKSLHLGRVFDDLTLVSNLTLIQGDITLTNRASEQGQYNTDRAMMGQSPYVVNAGLYYQNDSLGLQISAMYNIIGPRVVIAGIPDVPEVYEMSRSVLDLSITKTLKKGFSLRFGIQDIINQDVVFLQDANQDAVLSKSDDQLTQQLNRGSYFSLGVRYNFAQDKK